jgi:hypothetical protein
VGQETDLLVRAFRLPWTVAASWMAHSSPNAELLPGAGAGVGAPSSADRSSFTGEHHTRPPYNEVLGPADTSSDLSSGARRALLRSAASPALHDRFMATVCGGSSSKPQPATAGLGMPAAATPASDNPAPVAVAPVPANGVPAPASEGSASSSAASLAGSYAAELAHEEARLLAEAASWGAEAEADRCGGCVVLKCLQGRFLVVGSKQERKGSLISTLTASLRGCCSLHKTALCCLNLFAECIWKTHSAANPWTILSSSQLQLSHPQSTLSRDQLAAPRVTAALTALLHRQLHSEGSQASKRVHTVGASQHTVGASQHSMPIASDQKLTTALCRPSGARVK